jgi:hypothetical protein
MWDLIIANLFTDFHYIQKFKSMDYDLGIYRKQLLTGWSMTGNGLGKVMYHFKQCTIGSRRKCMYRWSDLGPDSSVVAAQLAEECTEFGEHSMYLTTYRGSAWATPASV